MKTRSWTGEIIFVSVIRRLFYWLQPVQKVWCVTFDSCQSWITCYVFKHHKLCFTHLQGNAQKHTTPSLNLSFYTYRKILSVILWKEPGSFKIIDINLYDLDFLFASKLKWIFSKLVSVITKRGKEGRDREESKPKWLFENISKVCKPVLTVRRVAWEILTDSGRVKRKF